MNATTHLKASKGDVCLNEQVLRVDHLKKGFGKTEVLHDISLTVSKGEVYGLVGQNGAGKTTLLRLITGLMKPTGGSISLHTEKDFVGRYNLRIGSLIQSGADLEPGGGSDSYAALLYNHS